MFNLTVQLTSHGCYVVVIIIQTSNFKILIVVRSIEKVGALSSFENSVEIVIGVGGGGVHSSQSAMRLL